MKTITELNSKMWYRLLKVIYLIIMFLFIVYAVVIAFSEVGSYQTDYTVVCNYGNKSTFLAAKDKEIYISTYYDYSNSLAQLPDNTKVDLREACEISEEELFAQMDSIVNGTDGGGKLFDLKETKVNVSTYFSSIMWSILAIVIILLFFEIIRRAFYYIILGKIRPPKF